MFEKFTDKARKVMSLAQEEARSLGKMYVGTEHLLLALIREGDSITVDIEGGALTLNVSDEELARRRAAWEPPAPKHDAGVLAKYAKLVTSADKGAIIL